MCSLMWSFLASNRTRPGIVEILVRLFSSVFFSIYIRTVPVEIGLISYVVHLGACRSSVEIVEG
jgi:hypothetical protein